MDTIKKITYVIKQGPTDLFTVDPQTGELKCTRGLDYERESNYTIVIGTAENQSDEPGATTKVIIQVEVIITNRLLLFVISEDPKLETTCFVITISGKVRPTTNPPTRISRSWQTDICPTR